MVLETARHPLILDGVNPIVNLPIKNTHVVNSHSGVEQTHSFLMKYYWILKCRLDKQYVSAFPAEEWLKKLFQLRCQISPVKVYRSKITIPFATTGLDFIGTFPIKECGKFAISCMSLFSGLVVRTVHLEILESLSTDSAMSCIRRFISRRGKPKLFILTTENLLSALVPN